MKTKLAVLVLVTLVALPVGARPVSEDKQVPIDLRRTTLVVRNIEASLQLYRDALGLKVVYDNVIRTPRSATNDEEADRVLRLVFLEANDDFVGIIGLLEYVKPEKPDPEQAIVPFSVGSSVLLFNAKDLDQRFETVRNTPGVTVVSEPSQVNYPSYDGSGTIPVMVSVITDPDGFVIELNQLLVDSVR